MRYPFFMFKKIKILNLILDLISLLSHSHWYDRHFNIHTGHIGGSSQREWIGEYTVLEGGRWEMIKRNLWQKTGQNKNQTKLREDTKKQGVLHRQTNPVNGW